MNKDSKLLILGATGLIGSACLRHFKQSGYTHIHAPTRTELNLLHTEKVTAYFKQTQPRIVILAAGIVGGIYYNQTKPADFINANLMIQLNVFQAAQSIAIDKFIFFASSCMYPRDCIQPMNEDLLLTGKPEITSMSYAIAKLAGVQMCRAYNQQFHADRYIALIPNSTFGPFDNFDAGTGHVMSAIMAKMHHAKLLREKTVTLWGTGSPRREFVYSDDVASAVMHVLTLDHVPSPLNIGVGADWSIKEIAEIIADVVGFKGEIIWDTSKPDGTIQKLLDSSKITALGFKPRIDIRTGIEKTYQWYCDTLKAKEQQHDTIPV